MGTDSISLTTSYIRSAFKRSSESYAAHKYWKQFSLFANNRIQPWISQSGKSLLWSNRRKTAAWIINHPVFEHFLILLIFFSAGITIYETDMSAKCFPKYANNLPQCPYRSGEREWVRHANLGILCLYTLEAMTRIYATRSEYFCCFWDYLDLVVVIAGWVGTVFKGGSIHYLRLLRFARLSRAFHIIRKAREIYLLMTGLGSAIKAMLVSSALLFILLVIFAIVMVEWVHPISSQLKFEGCQECTWAFQNVGAAVITLFRELIAGGSWLLSQKMVRRNTMLAFLMVFVASTVILGILNLILTVIVERAAEARDNDVQETARQRCLAQAQAREELMRLCAGMCTNSMGNLDLEQVFHAYENSEEFFYKVRVMDLDKEELQDVFMQADRDKQGQIFYGDFVDGLFHLKFQNQHLQLGLLRHTIVEGNHVLMKNLTSQIAGLDLELKQLKSHMQGFMETRAHEVDNEFSAPADKVHDNAPFPVQPLHSEAKMTIRLMNQSDTNLSNLSEAEVHLPEEMQQLQQGVKQLLEFESALVHKVVKPLDISLDKVNDLVHNVMKDNLRTRRQAIMTLEVWLAERKLELYKLASEHMLQTHDTCKDGSLSQQTCQHMGHWASDDTEFCSIMEIQQNLVNLLPQLFHLSRSETTLQGRTKNHQHEDNSDIDNSNAQRK